MAFEWLSPIPLDLEKIQALHLVKGCLATEGKLRDGNIMSRDNIVAGAGALRAVAAAGLALVDIDHHQHSLPAPYIEKYGSGIANPYPIGHVLDAQSVENNGIMSVEAIMMINNVTVYNLISAGNINGCSVVDLARKKVCDDTSCRFEGSAYIMNTIALEGTPNCANTWAAPVTGSDIGTIIKSDTQNHLASPIAKILQERLEHCASIPAIEARIV